MVIDCLPLGKSQTTPDCGESNVIQIHSQLLVDFDKRCASIYHGIRRKFDLLYCNSSYPLRPIFVDVQWNRMVLLEQTLEIYRLLHMFRRHLLLTINKKIDLMRLSEGKCRLLNVFFFLEEMSVVDNTKKQTVVLRMEDIILLDSSVYYW